MYGDKWRVGTVGYWPLRFSLWIEDKEWLWSIWLQRDTRENMQPVLCHAFIDKEDGRVEVARGNGFGQRDEVIMPEEEMEPTTRDGEEFNRGETRD